MKSNYIKRTCLALSLAITVGGSASAVEMQSEFANRGGLPAGGPYVPAGTLYDNEQSNGITSLASQDSSGTFTARSADDFMITQTCASGQFEITSVRVHQTIRDASPQSIAVDFFNDNGSGTAPESGINPIATVIQDSQTLLGPFGSGTSLAEVEFLPVGLVLNANTPYWISAYGTDAAANAGGFNAFFASSEGAAGTTDNSVIIAPGAGVADWTPVDSVIGPPALAFSFAIDGTCLVLGPPPVIPTLGSFELFLMSLMIFGVALTSIHYYRKS